VVGYTEAQLTAVEAAQRSREFNPGEIESHHIGYINDEGFLIAPTSEMALLGSKHEVCDIYKITILAMISIACNTKTYSGVSHD
jgi:hypothetical protein